MPSPTPADAATQLGAFVPDANVNTSPAGLPGLFSLAMVVVPEAYRTSPTA